MSYTGEQCPCIDCIKAQAEIARLRAALEEIAAIDAGKGLPSSDIARSALGEKEARSEALEEAASMIENSVRPEVQFKDGFRSIAAAIRALK